MLGSLPGWNNLTAAEQQELRESILAAKKYGEIKLSQKKSQFPAEQLPLPTVPPKQNLCLILEDRGFSTFGRLIQAWACLEVTEKGKTRELKISKAVARVLLEHAKLPYRRRTRSP